MKIAITSVSIAAMAKGKRVFHSRLAALLCIVACSVASEARPENSNTISSGVRRKPNILLFQPDDMPWVESWKEAPSLFDGNPNSIFRRNLDTPYMNRYHMHRDIVEPVAAIYFVRASSSEPQRRTATRCASAGT